MTTQTTTDFMEIVKGRRSIRNYDTNVKISKEEMTHILEEATLAPSSVNMQPWRFLVIDSAEGKATLAPLAKFNQVQVETSSAVIAVFGDMNAVDSIDTIYDMAVEKGLMPQDVRDRQVPAIKGFYSPEDTDTLRDSILIDSGLVSMQLMLVARAHGYDTNPIGGYEKDQIAEAFGMDKDRYLPVMLLSIGKAVDAGYPSVRLPINDITDWK
ncbi:MULTISPECIES: nitroreductase family protein [Exiguobacterium]|uniref:Nitroreductase family protein n=1 Tax=Exiguobacterium antarcticum TaxID=132920 RepID=A0ABT6R1D9_9BACL|nr:MULTISPECIES: nitroreductase family protein [Exiguobacterium]AFS71862.1 Nitroreductase [Exiguobacterium antarcticum B7]MCT4780300.1 nitroreductase family protein [Exiguobacterium soli]MDI3234618.1 nitroreductase family protein [Exiguobacterium antarcticum]